MKHSVFLCLLLKFAWKMFFLHFFVATFLPTWHFSMKTTEKSLMGGQFCKIYPPMRHASSSSPPEWIYEKLTLCCGNAMLLKISPTKIEELEQIKHIRPCLKIDQPYYSWQVELTMAWLMTLDHTRYIEGREDLQSVYSLLLPKQLVPK